MACLHESCSTQIVRRLAIIVLLSFAQAGIAQEHRVEIGGQYTYFRNQKAFFLNDSLAGVRLDAQLIRHLWLSGQLDIGLSTHAPPAVSSVDGGRMTLGRFGAKIGTVRHTFGLFAEIRTGFISWSDALIHWNLSPPSPQPPVFGRITEPLLNAGGIVELYVRDHLGVRICAGDSVVFYPTRKVVTIAAPFSGYHTNSADMSTGMFYRF